MHKLTASRFLTLFIVSFLWFGLLLYKWHNFELIDELLIIILFVYTISVYIKDGVFKVTKIVIYFISVVLFYLIYSFCLGIASTRAILFDCFQETKPYIVLICAIYLSPKFTSRQSVFIRYNCIFVFICALLNTHKYSGYLFGSHPTSIANLSITLFLVYSYFYDKTKPDAISLVMLTYGWLSGRSKFFAEFVIFLFMWGKKGKIKFKSKRFLSQSIFILFFVIILIWPKFSYYFIEGFDDGSVVARSLLYITSFRILIDYFPFGCGFGTFANYASMIFYSPIYHDYGLDKVWGLSETYPYFAADTFYPVLSQFGIVGLALIFFLWRKIFLINIHNHNMLNYKIALSIFVVFIIESFADTTFLGSRGVILLLLLGLITAQKQNGYSAWVKY